MMHAWMTFSECMQDGWADAGRDIHDLAFMCSSRDLDLWEMGGVTLLESHPYTDIPEFGIQFISRRIER